MEFSQRKQIADFHLQEGQSSDKFITHKDLPAPKHHSASLHRNTDHIWAKRTLDRMKHRTDKCFTFLS